MHDRRTRFSCLYAAGIVLALVANSALIAAAPADPAAEKTRQPDQKSAQPIRKLAGKHLTLVTDLPPSREINALIELFDLAFPEWCRLLAVDAEKHADWHVTAYLMKSRERFTAAGLLPKNLPEFKSGYSSGDSVWLYDQQSEYYRRHLLLHEGTHCFMSKMLGAAGPPWYAEGMAELLATHQWQDDRLTMAYFPKARREVPGWGRTKIVHDAFMAGRPLSLEKILAYDNRAHLENEPYGWCWAAAAFLDGHPRYRERFRKLQSLVARPDFAQQFLKLYADDWLELNQEWQVYVANLKYGYDFDRMAIEFAPASRCRRQELK